MSFTALSKGVREQLGQRHRYEHCVRVARLAENLARAHGEDARAARSAGMLHDLARLYPAPRLLDECALRKMPVDAFERRNPIVLHARLSAELARERFGVTDPAVLSAIAKHTVGAGSMSALDCILYLADGLEPGRNFPQRAELACLAERDLAAAMRATLLSTMQHLKERGIPASPETMAAAAAFALPTGDLEVRTA